MIESFGFSPTLQAALLVGLVLLEAILLYVGYGYLEAFAAPRVIDALSNTQ